MAKDTCHDNGVRREARSLSQQGYNVRADVDGYDKPPRICSGGSCGIPDIFAEKTGHTLIREVETTMSYAKDRPQQDIFRQYAQRRPGTDFDIRLC